MVTKTRRKRPKRPKCKSPLDPKRGILCKLCKVGVVKVARTDALGGFVRRYRKCMNPECGFSFPTIERPSKPE